MLRRLRGYLVYAGCAIAIVIATIALDAQPEYDPHESTAPQRALAQRAAATAG